MRRARMLLSGPAPSAFGMPGRFQGGKGCRIQSGGRLEYIDCDLREGTLIAGHAPEAIASWLAAHLDGPESDRRDDAAVEAHRAQLRQAMPWIERVLYTATSAAARDLAIGLAGAMTGDDRVREITLCGGRDLAALFPGVLPATVVVRCTGLSAAEAAVPALAALGARCRAEGVLLIFDEREFGLRSAPGGLAGVSGVVPDLCILGGEIGGGLPLAALVGRAAVIDEARRRPGPAGMGARLTAAQRAGANVLAAVAGRATLELLEAPGTRERLHETGRAILQSAERAIDSMPVPARIIGDSACFRVVFEPRPEAPDTTPLAERFESVLEARGVLQSAGRFYVSLAHDAEAIAQTVAALAGALESVAQLSERLEATSS